MLNFTLKFHTVAEKTANNFRGLLFLATPGRHFIQGFKPGSYRCPNFKLIL